MTATAQRRLTEGKTKPEIVRCLKRFIARELFHTLSADLADLPSRQLATPRQVVTISCGTGPIGRTRHRA